MGLLLEWTKGNTVEIRSSEDDLGGSMRLGAYECHISDGSLAKDVYQKEIIFERHRHRYEVNIKFKPEHAAVPSVKCYKNFEMISNSGVYIDQILTIR